MGGDHEADSPGHAARPLEGGGLLGQERDALRAIEDAGSPGDEVPSVFADLLLRDAVDASGTFSDEE